MKAEEEKAKQGGKSPQGKKVGLATRHVLGVRELAHDWIVDSGATCHIYNSKELFEDFRPLSEPQKVALGDGNTLEVIRTGAVEVKLELPGGESKIGRQNEVLYVPTLAYNLLSVAKTTEAGKTVTLGETEGKIIDGEGEVVAKAEYLYYLKCKPLKNEWIIQLVINPRRICGIGGLVIWGKEASVC